MKAVAGLKAEDSRFSEKTSSRQRRTHSVKNGPTGCDKRANYVSGTLMATWPIHLCLSVSFFFCIFFLPPLLIYRIFLDHATFIDIINIEFLLGTEHKRCVGCLNASPRMPYE